jgi:hypothetical protein
MRKLIEKLQTNNFNSLCGRGRWGRCQNIVEVDPEQYSLFFGRDK